MSKKEDTLYTELKKLYQGNFPFNHQNCSDECSKKYAEKQMEKDFVREIMDIFAVNLREDFEVQGDQNAVSQEWNRNLEEIIEWIYEGVPTN